MKILEFLAKFSKVKFGRWMKLEGIKQQIGTKAVENNAIEVAGLSVAYISTALPFIPKHLLLKLYWEDLIFLQLLISKINYPRGIPLLTSQNGKVNQDIPWEYDGRTYYYLIHTLASEYGWTVEYISNLSVDDAMALVQEIFTDEHLTKEFTYSLSENAYQWNKTTKQSIFKPMERPYWMLPKAKEIKKIKIPKWLMPVGYQDVSGMEKVLDKKNDTSEEVKSS